MENRGIGKRAFSGLVIVAILVAAIVSLSPAPVPSAEKPIELRFTTVVTSIHPNFKAFQKFADEVAKKTDGKVHITVYPSGTLNPPFETYNAIKTGIAQMGCAPVGFSGQIMPANKLFGDALRGFPTAEGASRAYGIALKEVPELLNEFEGVHLLWVFSTLPMSIGTGKKPINKVEDFKGLVMRFPPGLEPLARAWGATPISVPIADIYVALQKGTVQGFVGGAEMLQSMRLAEHIKYVTSADMIYGLAYVGINKKAWDSLPPDVQKVMDGLAEWAQGITIEDTDAADKGVMDYAKAQGTEITKMSKQEMDRLADVSKPVFEKMAADLEGRGKPGKKVLAEVEKLSRK